MKSLPVKLGVGSVVAFFLIIMFGFVGFPMIIKSKVKKMVNLGPGTEIRDMFLELPFPLKFKVYLFNVTNPMEIQNGALPEVNEVGPFCYEEWKQKVNVSDNDKSDTISYFSKDTFIKTKGPGCKSGHLTVTIPHPMILGPVNQLQRRTPGTLSIFNKALKTIYNKPDSIFVNAAADDLIFNGIDINCGVADFAGRAVCVEFKALGTLEPRDNNILAFSLIGMKNGTIQKKIKARRGTTNHHEVGRILEYDEAATMSIWPTKECNTIHGTDSTIFPPMLKKEEGLANFSPELCRSLVPFWVRKTKYHGIPVNEYQATFGDMSKNEKEKCYCYTLDTCLKKGLMDLYKCNGIAPIYASLPHFYDSDQSYVDGVKGLKPNKEDHKISILFEQLTGSPVQVRKRIMFSMPLEKNRKVDLFKNFSNTVIPIAWIEESLDLNSTYTKPLKMLYSLKRIVNVFTWAVILASLGGMAGAGYLFYKNINLTTTISATDNIASRISKVGDHLDKPENEAEKY